MAAHLVGIPVQEHPDASLVEEGVTARPQRTATAALTFTLTFTLTTTCTFTLSLSLSLSLSLVEGWWGWAGLGADGAYVR